VRTLLSFFAVSLTTCQSDPLSAFIHLFEVKLVSELLYPVSHLELLRLHFSALIANSLKTAAEIYTLDDPDDDEEWDDTCDNRVSIWEKWRCIPYWIDCN
jgi:hypothetical protein